MLRGSTTGGLLHKFIITDLCRKDGVQWHASKQLQQPMAIINHLTIDRYRAWDGAISHPRGEGYIMIPPPSPQSMDKLMAKEVEVEPSLGFQRRIQRQNLRLAQLQSIMHDYNIGAFKALTNAFSLFSPNTDPVQQTIPPVLLSYPPSDNYDDEY